MGLPLEIIIIEPGDSTTFQLDGESVPDVVDQDDGPHLYMSIGKGMPPLHWRPDQWESYEVRQVTL